jgi:hypothetical protein
LKGKTLQVTLKGGFSGCYRKCKKLSLINSLEKFLRQSYVNRLRQLKMMDSSPDEENVSKKESGEQISELDPDLPQEGTNLYPTNIATVFETDFVFDR